MGTTSRGWPLPDDDDKPEVWKALGDLGNAASNDMDNLENDLRPRVEDLEALGLTGTELRVISTFVGGANTSVTTVASNIPGGYTHLLLFWRGGSNTNNQLAHPSIRFNGSCSGYDGFNGWATSAGGWTINDEVNGTAGRAAVVGGSPSSFGTIWIPYYQTSVGNRPIRAESFARGVGGSSTTHAYGIGAGVWNNSAPITSIQLWPSANSWDTSGVRVSLIGFR